MAEISKQALKVENNTEFPNNNAGVITPSRLRTFNIDMIDSLVDEISYNADSASWEQSIAALEAFTGSATGLTTGSLLITASANLNTITFTKGDSSTFNITVNTGSDATDLGPLNTFTASVAGTNAFTQSANLRLASLEATTASLNTSVNSLNVFTQSIQTEVDNIQAVTASYATTGSNTFVGNQTIVGSVSASSFVSASKFVGDGSQITGITASVATSILNDGVFQGTATSLNFTGSGVNASVVAGVAIIQAEVDQAVLDRYTTTASFNAYTQSTDAELDAINAFTASVAGTNAFTQSANSRLNSLEAFTASLDTTYVTQAELAAATGALEDSIDTKLNTSSFDAFSQSIDSRVDALEAFSTSLDTNFASQTEFNAFTQSADGRLDAIEAQSGSWVTAAITASSLQTASFAAGTLTFTKGDGSTFGVVIPDVSGSAGDFVTTASFNAYTQSNDTKWDNLGSQTGSFITESETGSFAKTTGFTGFQTFDANIDNVFSGSTYIAGAKSLYLGANSTIETGDGANMFISGSIYMNRAAGASELVVNKIKSLGNTAQYPGQSKVLNIYGDVDISGSFTAPLQEGYAWVGDGTNKAVQVATSSFAGSTPAGTISSSAQITELGFVSSSITASSIVTASATNATITFTKGDASTFSVTVATGSAVSASYAETASLAQFAEDIIVTVKNTTGAQLNKGTIVRIIGATGDNALIQTASWEDDNNSANTLGWLYENIANDGFGRVITQGTLLGVNTDPALGYVEGQMLYLSSSGQFTNVVPPAPYHEVRLGQVLRAQQNNGSVYVLIQNGYELGELHDVNISTGSLADRDILAYNSASGQWENQTAIELGLATTGSNAFIGVESISGNSGSAQGEIYLLGHSGSLVVGNFTYTPTYAGLSHISSSQINTNTNLIFKNSSATQSTIVSGSANIFANSAAATAGFVRYVGGSSNIYTHGNSVPQITGSITSNPIAMNGNIFSHTQTNAFTFRAAASASASTINQNILMGGQLNFGTDTTNNAEKLAQGVTVNNNAIFGGNINLVAAKTTLVAAPAITGNLLFGAGVSLNHYSSSAITYTSNIQNGGITVNNEYEPIGGSVTAAKSARVNLNTIYGFQHQLNFKGANTSTTQTKHFFANILAGMFLTASVGDGDSANMLASGMIGNNLIFSGSSTAAAATATYTPNDTQGSFVAGRFNALDGKRASSAETVFAVGTGTSTARKTGFLIDSGSNTFVEGSLNVSGSTSVTGSMGVTGNLNITGALTSSLSEGYVWVGGAGNVTTLLSTSSFLDSAGFNSYTASTNSRLDSIEAVTASFATTGSNTFVGNQTINASLDVSSSVSFSGSLNVLSGSASGSVVTNVGDTFTGTAAVTKIISLSSAEYTALSPKDPNTLYIIV